MTLLDQTEPIVRDQNKKRRVGLDRWGWVAVAALLAGCQRPPQTAEELLARMPHEFRGEAHLQGETRPRPVVITIAALTVQAPHLLAFGRVDFRLSDPYQAGSEEMSSAAEVHGTIAAPGGEIVVDSVGGEAGNALSPGSFTGKLANDLQSVEARWTSGYGQSIGFTGRATKR